MIPGQYDFKTQKAGDTFNGIQLTIALTSQGVTNPIDLTGAIVRMYVRKSSKCPTILELSSDSNIPEIVFTDAVNGVLRIEPLIVPSVTSFKYKYDMEFTYPNGVIKTYLKGFFPIEEDITK